jgi:hypothetical protein
MTLADLAEIEELREMKALIGVATGSHENLSELLASIILKQREIEAFAARTRLRYDSHVGHGGAHATRRIL